MVLNRGPDAKRASAALCLGRGCQEEESSDCTMSQSSSRHSGRTATEGAPLCRSGDGHGARPEVPRHSKVPVAASPPSPKLSSLSFFASLFFKAEVLS